MGGTGLVGTPSLFINRDQEGAGENQDSANNHKGLQSLVQEDARRQDSEEWDEIVGKPSHCGIQAAEHVEKEHEGQGVPEQRQENETQPDQQAEIERKKTEALEASSRKTAEKLSKMQKGTILSLTDILRL